MMNRQFFNVVRDRCSLFFLTSCFVLSGALLVHGAEPEPDNNPVEKTLPSAATETEAATEMGAEGVSCLPLAEELLGKIKTQDTSALWENVNLLVRMGRLYGNVVSDRLEKELQSSDDKSRLAAARALSQLGKAELAAPTLHLLLQKAATPALRALTANAIGLTTPLYSDETTAAVLASALKSESDDSAKICIARSLWRITSRNDGRDELLHILAASASKEVKDEAALVLAENGSLAQSEVRTRLLTLYAEPTPQGERAFNLLRHSEETEPRGKDKKTRGEMLMSELLNTIKSAYPDESKYDVDKLFEQAAKGMISSLDPFSQYMDRDEVKSTQEMLQQDYGGIGAYVGMSNGSFIVTSPIYGSPADRAGLRAHDIIQEVNGRKSTEMLDKGGLSGVLLQLKGEPGSRVRVKYFRRGFMKAVEVDIVRERIRIESVFSTMLPGNVGYLRLTRFGEHSSEEVKVALDALKKQNMQALIFDLRDNPGGLLRGAVDVADQFLSADKLIVYSEGNKEFSPRKPYFSTGGTEDENLPLICLVGAGSASASEIVAGAFQDHKRATLIGEKTYGKGSVQQIMPVRATERETQLRLTIAKYYLPSGRCIHEKGVEVDIEVKPSDLRGWVVEKIAELRRRDVFEDYIQSHWETSKDALMKLAVGDEEQCDRWPEFEKFFKSLKTQVEPNDIRQELRAVCRRHAQDELKKEFVVDLQEDNVLRRGVLEALIKLKVDPIAFTEYKTLPEKFKKKDEPALEGAMLPNSEK